MTSSLVELLNAGSREISLANWQLAGGIEADLPPVTVAAGERVVVVKDADAFSARYGQDITVVGTYDGRLRNSGEEIQLVDPSGAAVLVVDYGDSDPWYERADGIGASLELIDPADTPIDAFSKHYSWRASTELGGTPGAEGFGPSAVVINEVLSNSAIQVDAIELKNRSSEAIDIGGWFLSDSSDNLLKYQIPAGTTIEAGGFVVFDETHFNPNPLAPAPNDFAISSFGDDLWLTSINDGLLSIKDDLRLPAAKAGESFARLLPGGRVLPAQRVTLGEENSAPRIGPVVLSEVNYNPSEPTPAAIELEPTISSGDLEFVELFNASSEAIDLQNWRLRRGVSFDFPAGATIEAGEAIVLARSSTVESASTLAAFKAHYGIDETRVVLGFEGRLENTGEVVRLQQPGHTAGDDVAHYLIDEILYDDRGEWPTETNGLGDSLNRVSASSLGIERSSWFNANPTPGTFEQDDRGDFNHDGQIDDTDIDLLLAQIRAGGADLDYDLTGDGQVDEEDRDELIVNILETTYGDANLDGVFNSNDFVQVFGFGEYEGRRAR